MADIAYSLLSLGYTILLMLVYFIKKKIKTIENILFSRILILTFIGLVLQILNYYAILFGIDIYSPLYLLMDKLILLYYVIWMVLFTYYVSFLPKREKELKELKRKKNKKYIILILMALCILILALPLDIKQIDNLYIPDGLATQFTYIASLICIFIMILFLLFDIKNVKNKSYVPLYVLIVLGITCLVLQYYQPQLLLLSPMHVVICFVMYFTIENPDVKIIEQLNLAKVQAEKANNAKTEFLSSMSHEIRTPLNAIVGFSECIANADNLESAKSDAKDIVMASQNLLEIVNGILDISKIEANKMEIIETNYELEPILKNISKLMIPRIGEKPIELRNNFAIDIPAVLNGDSGKIKQIITNILTNAVKYTEKGQINFNVNCINEKDTCSLIISVEDTGRGIKEEKISSLFNKFERLEEDKNTTIEGTGLGLAITKKLIEMMGGKIIVQSKYGVGSKFTVYLKQKIVSMEKPKTEETEKIEQNIDFNGNNILVVDDNKMNLKVATRILKEYNINVCESESGLECIERIKANEKYDLILMDDMMPRMSGVETLKELKQLQNFNIPVIALTANALEGMREKYLKEGFNDYLSKPFNKIELEDILKKYLNKKENISNVKEKELPTLKEEIEYDLSNKKVLLVDDNKLNTKVAELMLRKYNLQIESVESGFECLEKIKTNNYDLIFMDYMMPEMDGIETFHKLKEIQNFNTPVVALTADAIEGARERFLKEGFDDYISKPIDKALLEQVVLKFLNKN